MLKYADFVLKTKFFYCIFIITKYEGGFDEFYEI